MWASRAILLYFIRELSPSYSFPLMNFQFAQNADFIIYSVAGRQADLSQKNHACACEYSFIHWWDVRGFKIAELQPTMVFSNGSFDWYSDENAWAISVIYTTHVLMLSPRVIRISITTFRFYWLFCIYLRKFIFVANRIWIILLHSLSTAQRHVKWENEIDLCEFSK